MILERISADLQLPMDFLEKLARSASYHYKTYVVPKKNNRGTREIHHPSKELKTIQRWFLRHVLEGLPVSEHAVAYRKGVSIGDNARRHARSRFLLRLDFEDFFPSLTDDDIRNYSAENPHLFEGWSADDLGYLCAFLCRFRRITIGAPTSPCVSNALCNEFDRQVAALADARAVNYTRYADDVFLSTDVPETLREFPRLVEGITANLTVPAALRLNSRKTAHSSKKGRREVTGLVLCSDGSVSVGRRLKRKVRAMVNKVGELDPDTIASLAGYIAFIQSQDANFINSLILKYGDERVRKARGR